MKTKTLGGGAKEKMMLNKMRRNAKALSPIFATLILIAIAVIAGIVVYMFTSGTIATMTGGGTAGQEKAAIQGVNVASTPPAALAQNTGGVEIVINTWLLKSAGGSIVDQGPVVVAEGTLTTDGALVPVPIDLTAATTGQSYTITLVSTKGGSFVSSSFVP